MVRLYVAVGPTARVLVADEWEKTRKKLDSWSAVWDENLTSSEYVWTIDVLCNLKVHYKISQETVILLFSSSVATFVPSASSSSCLLRFNVTGYSSCAARYTAPLRTHGGWANQLHALAITAQKRNKSCNIWLCLMSCFSSRCYSRAIAAASKLSRVQSEYITLRPWKINVKIIFSN